MEFSRGQASTVSRGARTQRRAHRLQGRALLALDARLLSQIKLDIFVAAVVERDPDLWIEIITNLITAELACEVERGLRVENISPVSALTMCYSASRRNVQ